MSPQELAPAPIIFPLTPKEEQFSDLNRSGDWTMTFTGRKFWHLDPKPGDFHLLDIATGLSNECRFGGQAPFLSVAQHCLLVHHFVDLDTQGQDGAERTNSLKGALLHDAAEAYMKDIPRPQKRWWGAYKAAEVFVIEQIFKRFDVPITFGETHPLSVAVKKADEDALVTEAMLLYPDGRAKDWDVTGLDRRFEIPEFMKEYGPTPKNTLYWEFKCLSHDEARDHYLATFKNLFQMDKEAW